MKEVAKGSLSSGAAPLPMDKRQKKLRDELAQLESYVLTLKDVTVRSLSALQDDLHAHRGSPTAAALVPHLQKQIEDLRAENAAIRSAAAAQAPAAAAGAAAAAAAAVPADPKRVAALEATLSAEAKRFAALEAQFKALSEQLDAAQRREQEQKEALAAAAARENEQAAAIAQLRQNGTASTSTSRAAAPPLTNGAAAAPAAAPAGLAAVQAQLSKLRDDKEALEGQIVEMYESFFSDKLVKGIVNLLRKKEAALISNSETRALAAEPGDSSGKPAGTKLKAKLDEARIQIDKLEREMELKEQEFNALQRHHDDIMKIHKLESEGQINLMRERWTQELVKRKKLHQKVLELKGAIRVFCRVRPLVTKEDGNTTACVVVKDEENLSITVERDDRTAELNTGGNGGTRRPPTRAANRTPPRRGDDDEAKSGREFSYEFDRVFSPSDSQETVYEDVEDLIVSVADGYNVCIMAYGQTGSGKTYTMQGPPENPGINIRALKSLFQLSIERQHECTITFTCSILEIYNESIFDLLSDTPRESASKLDIKEQGGHIWIPHLQMVKVTSMEDVEQLIERGHKNRSTFATDMNEHSSRSHLILSMYLRCDNKITGEKTASKLHLIDLAGSERVSRSHAEGDRLREAQNINSSLSALGDVIQSLQLHKEHIPYRNCKLTRLLSDSLGGQSKTLLVVNLSPTRESGSESRCSCDFASRAKKVELGKATKQIEGGSGGVGTRTSPTGGAPRSFSASRVKSAHQLSADPTKLRSVPH